MYSEEEEKDQFKNLFTLINDHRKKLNEIKNIGNDTKYSQYDNNRTFDSDNKNEEIYNYIKSAKEFLNNNKLQSSRMITNVDNTINSNKSKGNNYINYSDINNDTATANHSKNQISYLTKYNNNNNNNEQRNNDRNYFIEYYTYDNRTKEKNKKSEEKTIIDSNIELLKSKLANKESEIKRLEYNINHLTEENQQLKEYINKLESNFRIFNSDINTNTNNNNNNDFFSENSQNLKNNENILQNEVEFKNNQIKELINKDYISTINENNNNSIDMIMSTINNFIRKMYMIFNDIIGQKEEFIDLNCNQYKELQNHLANIENIINNIVVNNLNENKFNDDSNYKNSTDNKNEFDYNEILKGIKASAQPPLKPVKYPKGKICEKSEKMKKMKKRKIGGGGGQNKSKNKNIKRCKSHDKIFVFQRNTNPGKTKTKKKVFK